MGVENFLRPNLSLNLKELELGLRSLGGGRAFDGSWISLYTRVWSGLQGACEFHSSTALYGDYQAALRDDVPSWLGLESSYNLTSRAPTCVISIHIIRLTRTTVSIVTHLCYSNNSNTGSTVVVMIILILVTVVQ